MALRISIKKDEPEGDKESVMEVFMISERTGEVSIKAMDADGDEFYIATIDDEGITLHTGISKDSGWPLDKKGHIHLVPESD